jgi:hypothetical protein
VLKRIHAPAAAIDRARCVFDMTTLLRLDEPVLRLAEHVGPPVRRSLDAIRLASALSIGDVPEAFITYDDRLAAAAHTLKLHVLQPGRAEALGRRASGRVGRARPEQLAGCSDLLLVSDDREQVACLQDVLG